MTRPPYWLAAALLILLASCGPAAAPVSTATSTPLAAVATPVPHAPEIRFALVGEVTAANVWALFDAKGYSYNNYAIRSEYWPRLYRLSIPDRQFQPMAAGGMPSPVQHDGDFYTAAVPLRSDLNWTDGTPFTAEDVAFTVNTALSFQLGFDWHDYYDPAWLDHAEAVDAHTVKFYFRRAPNVGVWQYGALQGPIVQKAYWLPRIAASQALLPPADLASQIEALTAKVADLQRQVDALNLSAATTPTSGEEARQNQMTLNHQQRDLNAASSDLAEAQSDFAAAMSAGRASLYALDDVDEPTLGNWLPAGGENGAWVNKANPLHPFGGPNFDRAAYSLFPDQASAFAALENNEVELVLDPDGLSADVVSKKITPPLRLAYNVTSNANFIVINPADTALADPAFRQALSCVIDNGTMGRAFLALPLDAFVSDGDEPWSNPNAVQPCKGQVTSDRRKQAVEILKSAGYTWQQEPADTQGGEGLMRPDGTRFPQVTLLSAAPGTHSPSAAEYIERYARDFGIPLTARSESAQDVRYKVFSSEDYDMAILGWRLSAYPGYLCEWFGDGNPFHYQNDRLRSACEALNSTSDLAQARRQVDAIQSILAQDLPFIPLYSGLTYDAYRNVSYPFDQVPGGLSGVYGAPSLAIPASH